MITVPSVFKYLALVSKKAGGVLQTSDFNGEGRDI